jgi:hypothetical protein
MYIYIALVLRTSMVLGFRKAQDTGKTLSGRLAQRRFAAPRRVAKIPALSMRTKEKIVQKSLIALGLVFSLLCSWSITRALAADFYILNVTDEHNVSLLDPTTIVSAQNGH